MQNSPDVVKKLNIERRIQMISLNIDQFQFRIRSCLSSYPCNNWVDWYEVGKNESDDGNSYEYKDRACDPLKNKLEYTHSKQYRAVTLILPCYKQRGSESTFLKNASHHLIRP